MSDKGEKTRTRILESADQLFYRRGYGGTSFSDIVDAVGIYRGNIYHYFKSKEAILQAVLEKRVEETEALLKRWDAHYDDPRDRLGQFVRLSVDNGGDLVRYGCFAGTLNSELAKDQRDLQRFARPLLDLFRDWLAARFSDLGRGQEARSLALHLLGRVQGISVVAHAYQDIRSLEYEVHRLEVWIDALG
ncbi:MAG: TetR/AcrR family transcriptional regulator [Acidiferrobacteraceae bacterium]